MRINHTVGGFLSPSCKDFKEILLYSNNDAISLEDVKANLLSREKYDLEMHFNGNDEGLSVTDRPPEKEDTSRRNFRSKSKGSKSCKFCKYCRKLGQLNATNLRKRRRGTTIISQKLQLLTWD